MIFAHLPSLFPYPPSDSSPQTHLYPFFFVCFLHRYNKIVKIIGLKFINIASLKKHKLSYKYMDKQYESISNKQNPSSLQRQFNTLNKNELPSGLGKIIEIFRIQLINRMKVGGDWQQVIDRICEEGVWMEEKRFKVVERDEEFENRLEEFLGYCFQNEVQINANNQYLMIKYRELVSTCFHLLVHYTTLKNIPKLMILFYKLLSWQMLELKMVNYFMFMLILSHQNLTTDRDKKIIKRCLISLYSKKIVCVDIFLEKIPKKPRSSNENYPINCHLYEKATTESLSFTILTYLIYLGNIDKSKTSQQIIAQQTKIIGKIFQDPVILTSILLTFRYEFPNQYIKQCNRSLSSLSYCVIDNFLFKSLLNLYLDFKLQTDYRNNIYSTISNFLQFNLTTLTVKNIIKKLEISNSEDSEARWKKVLQLFKQAIPESVKITAQHLYSIHDNSKIESHGKDFSISNTSPKKQSQQIQQFSLISNLNKLSNQKLNDSFDTLYLSPQSYIKYPQNEPQQFISLNLIFRSYRINSVYLLLRLKGEKKQQIWITIIYLGGSLFQISAILWQDNKTVEMSKITQQWNPFVLHSLEMKIIENKIIFKFHSFKNNDINSKEQKQSGELQLKNIKPNYIEIRTVETASSDLTNLTPYISEIIRFNIKHSEGKIYDIMGEKEKQYRNSQQSIRCMKYYSLPAILKKLGDVDLFFLVTYHLIKKVENSQSLISMIEDVINLLEYIVVAKGVVGVKLSPQSKQYRFYSVRCLVWLASKQKKDPEVIFQLFRLLSIRGMKKPTQCLQILCNIGLWKQMSCFSHFKIIQKIKQYCSAIEYNQTEQIISFMRSIILDFIIFYKYTEYSSQNLQEEYLMKHSQILKLVYDCIVCQKIGVVLDFIFFLLKILYLIVDRTRNADYMDRTVGFQIANLAFRLLYFIREEQFQSYPKQKLGSPGPRIIRTNKLKLSTAKSMSIPLISQKSEEDILLTVEEILMWTNQIIYCFNNQLLYQGQKIKYYDWDWDFKQSSSANSMFSGSNPTKFHQFFKRKLKNVSENQILTLCQYIQVGLFSFNKAALTILIPSDPTETQSQIFWDMNVFDDRISNERIIQTLKQGGFDKIVWDDKKVSKILTKSFAFLEINKTYRLPHKLLESMKIENINTIHNMLIGIYLEKCMEVGPLEKEKCAQNILYLISLIPGSLYSNTQLLREQLSKQKRNAKTLQIVQTHLILKQLSNECFKLVSKLKKGANKEFISTICAFDENASTIKQETNILPSKTSLEAQKIEKQAQSKINADIMSQSWALDSVDFQESFTQTTEIQKAQDFDVITTQMMKKSLEYYKLLATPGEMQNFYKLSLPATQNKNDLKELIEGHILNFNINIDAIIEILQQNSSQLDKVNQLQSYIFFIEKHIYNFSKMILNEYIFQQQIKVEEERLLKPNRKKSLKMAKNCKIKEQSGEMLEQFLKQRRKSVYKMEKIWLSVEKNNKSFWQIFFKSEPKHQSVDLTCNPLKMRGLIKIDHQKRSFQLPKNITLISSKFSISGDSEKEVNNQCETQGSIFQDAALYCQQESSEKDKQEDNKTLTKHQKQISQAYSKKQRKRNQFPVLYITTQTIYQGVIFCQFQQIIFKENPNPDHNFYDLICASKFERRTNFQIQKNQQKFVLHLNEKCTIIPKKYLYHDAAVQIYSQNQTKFLVFRKQDKRQQFLKFYSNYKGIILNELQLFEVANKQMQRWMNGDISNFKYLMHLNDLAGRTFNDMSQYYIFPWILTNYDSQKFNKKFLNNKDNYRDLFKPVGALNPRRFQDIINRYNETARYDEMQGFLYGSYCSNPAIVCNYLVRLEPFSMHHYFLQSYQFDLADRIFFSVANQFKSCYTNVGDYKQLIPEFYSCPQFLRNRNKYKFGQRQNKQVVNNVQLPEWAYYDFEDNKKTMKRSQQKLQPIHPQQKFIFRMRKCLQSQNVTENLHLWIDLMFGPYTIKQKAMQRNNLYNPNIYKNQLSKKDRRRSTSSRQGCHIFFKQFGQTPRELFERDHKSYRNTKTYYKIGNSQIFKVAQLVQQSTYNKNFYADNRYLIYWDNLNINIIDIKNKSGLLSKTQDNVLQIPLKQECILGLKTITADNNWEENKKMDFLIYLKNNKLTLRQMSISTFRKKLEIKDELVNSCSFETISQILQIYHEYNLIIIAEQNVVKIFSFELKNLDKDVSPMLKKNNPETGSFSIPINKKTQLKMNLKFEFTQHRSKIQHIRVLNSYGLLISVDNNRKAYILKINSKQIEVIQYFRLKKLTNCQQILSMQLHDMGYIIILTSLSNIHVYNLMGDYIGIFNKNTLKQINKKMEKKMHSWIDTTIQSKSIITVPSTNTRKKSGNEIKANQKVTSCEYIDSDSQTINNNNVMIEDKTQDKQKLEFQQMASIHQQDQLITIFKIWNHESGQLIIGTNLGGIYRIDLFMLDDSQKINLNSYVYPKDKNTKDNRKKSGDKIDSKNIDFITVQRIGRHWQCWIANEENIFKIESEDYVNAQKRNEQYHKKYVLE